MTSCENVEAGGLASYGIDLVESYRRAAKYVDKIVSGENPGEIPAELPTKFELVINIKTAKAIGITIPESFLVAEALGAVEPLNRTRSHEAGS